MYNEKRLGAAVLGSHYSNALTAIDTAASETYLPYPDAAMSCDTLQGGISAGTKFINIWQGRLAASLSTMFPSQTEIQNIRAILSNLKGKVTQYQTLLAACLQQQQQDTETPEPGPGSPDSGKGGSGSMLLLLAAVGGFLYFKSKNKGRRK